jgi:hypothetical protein
MSSRDQSGPSSMYHDAEADTGQHVSSYPYVLVELRGTKPTKTSPAS